MSRRELHSGSKKRSGEARSSTPTGGSINRRRRRTLMGRPHRPSPALTRHVLLTSYLMSFPARPRGPGSWFGVGFAVLALLVPVAAATWSLRTTTSLGDRLENSRELSQAYERTRSTAAVFDQLPRTYDRNRPVAGRAALAATARRLRRDLAEIEALGAPADSAFAENLRRDVSTYEARALRTLELLDAGRYRNAWFLHSRSRATSVAPLEKRVYAAWQVERASSDVALATLGEVQRVAFASGGTLAALLVVLVVGPLRRFRRTAAEAQRRELERLTEAVITDHRTGLRNHYAFQEDLSRWLKHRNGRGGSLALLMVDLDGLKETNETQGHQAGDARIIALADCFRATLAGSSRAYRVGGDEFAVILPDSRAWPAFELAQRLGREAEAAGAGVAIGVTETTTVELKETVVRRADLALIEAKRSQRTAVIYSPGLEPSLRRDPPRDHYAKVLATSLARVVDAKDRGTGNHCETVAELAVGIGERLGLDATRLEQLRLAALLHDVGKVGVPDAVLSKRGALDSGEVEAMQTHVLIGHSILETAELKEEAHWVLHHHERVDGFGYPQGLSGGDIPIESRIIAVADGYEAIISDRPYRSGVSREAAVDELERNAGTQFDADCVGALKAVFGLDGSPRAAGANVVRLREAMST
jgi:diguanylate cyclase (GGDEF)-like protein